MYDVAIVGAGITGSALAFFLTQAGQKVLLLDAAGIAAGGSGAAGAFVSPKIAKEGALKALSEEAFLFALEFYERYFPHLTRFAPLLHVSTDPTQNEKIEYFKKHTALKRCAPSSEAAAFLAQHPQCASVMIERSALVDAAQVCREMAQGAEVLIHEVKTLTCKPTHCQIDHFIAKKAVLCIGAYRPVLTLPYVSLRGIWGHRIDIATSTQLPFHLHQHLSVAATCEGRSAIGATHDVHYHPQYAQQPYDIEAGRQELLRKAAQSLSLEHVEVLRDYTGLRSGSNDYLPLLGPLVDAEATCTHLSGLRAGRHYERAAFSYHPNVLMFNGVGGYGFVLGPYLAREMARHLTQGVALSATLDPTRFFERWVKRR